MTILIVEMTQMWKLSALIMVDGIRTCLHLCSRFVGEERGVHTQVENSLIFRS